MKQQFQKQPSQDLLQATADVCILMAGVQTIRPVVQAIQDRILKADTYLNQEDGTRITDANHNYLMNDEQFQTYLVKLHEGYLAAGFEVAFEVCPLLTAEYKLTQAERKMITLSQELHDLFKVEDVYLNMQHLEKYKKLCLSYLVQFVPKNLLPK